MAKYKLYFKSRRYTWCGPQYQDACHECVHKQYNASAIGFLANVTQNMWMAKLDCFTMWFFQYPRLQLLRELHPTNHEAAHARILSFQQTMSSWYEVQMRDGFDGNIFQRVPKEDSKALRRPSSSSTATRKPASGTSTLKRPSSSLILKKLASTNRLHLKHAGKTRIFIADETHLNKRKPNVLAKHGRPQRDPVWLWGAVLHGHVRTHFTFRVLKRADEAFDGKPRGHKEMVHNINLLGLRKGDIFVSDKWKATLSALQCFRRDEGFTEQQLRDEIANNSAREITNQNGFCANAIECKWSVVKRWIRQKMSGILPTHSDRQKWTFLINEYQARSLFKAQASHSFDRGHTRAVRFHDLVRLFRVG